MDADRFDSLTRAFDVNTRRRLFGALPAALAFGPLTFRSDAEAKKKRKKNKKKNSCPVCPSPPLPPPPPPTCAEACPSNCGFCFIRPGEAPTMCGDASSPDSCIPCSSDNGCIENVRPYCVAQAVDRVTGEVTTFCGGNPGGGFCTSINACA